MIMNDLSQNETLIIQALRELKPFERIEIVKDKEGKVDSFLVHRSQKFLLLKEIRYVK